LTLRSHHVTKFYKETSCIEKFVEILRKEAKCSDKCYEYLKTGECYPMVVN